jgi:hypothetical protein
MVKDCSLMRTKAWLVSSVITGIIVLAAGAGRAAPEDSVVKLPTYTVTDSRDLPEPESWRYTTIPSYEILSQISEAKTQSLAQDLARMDALLDHVWPGIKSKPRPETTLILCGTRKQFAAFMPQSVRTAIDPLRVDRLFLSGDTQGIVVLDTSALNNGKGFEKDLVRHYILSRLGMFYPKLPPWFAEGLARIVATSAMEEHFGKTTMTIGLVNKVVMLTPASPESNPAVITGPGLPPPPLPGFPSAAAKGAAGDSVDDIIQGATEKDTTVLDFNQYFAGDLHPLPSLPMIFAEPTPENHADWVEAATMFTHFCFYGERKHWKENLIQFLELTSHYPGADPEPYFQQAFHLSYPAMEVRLAAYVSSTDYTVSQYTVSEKGIPVPSNIREATQGEIGQIKGDAFLRAGYPDAARQEMVAAYRREKLSGQPAEPRLIAALGFLEATAPDGDGKNARALLEASASDHFPRVGVYEALAKLHLADTLASQPLDAPATAAALLPLNEAHALGLPDPEDYELIAQVWARSSVTPSRHDLAVLNEGIHYFPYDSSLALAAIALNARAGYRDTARAIADFGAGAAGDPRIKADFVQWQARL